MVAKLKAATGLGQRKCEAARLHREMTPEYSLAAAYSITVLRHLDERAIGGK